MIKFLLLLLAPLTVFAQEFSLESSALGSNVSNEPVHAIMLDRGNGEKIYHAPQYLPGHPTAATIWPRVVQVKCTQVGKTTECENYKWLPEMGRPEYIFVVPTFEKPVQPVNTPPVIIIREVKQKKGAG